MLPLHLLDGSQLANVWCPRFQSSQTCVAIVQSYTLVLDSTKKDYCKLLENTLDEIHRHDIKILQSDFNA